MGKAVLRKTV